MKKFILCLLILGLSSGIAFAGFGEERLNTETADEAVSTYPYKLIFPNGSLTDNGDDTTSISFLASGAPTNADYLVGTANGSLSAEIVVGTAPGGELGGTWASPTIDDSLAVTSWNLTTPTITTSATMTDASTIGLGSGKALIRFDDETTDYISLMNANVGIGTTGPDKALEINSATGANLRLTYNDSNGTAANYADFSTSSSGDLTIAPSGGDTNITGNASITGDLQVTDITVVTGGTLQLGADGVDGELKIYSDQGATDYIASLKSNASMASAATFYLPADEPAGESFLKMGTDGIIDYDTTVLGSIATQAANNVSISGGSVTGITDLAVADGGTALSTIADGSILAANSADTLSAITWHDAGTKVLTNTSGTISWESAGAGSGDVTSVGDCADGACFDGTQGTTLTFNNAGGDATIDYDGTDFSFSKFISANLTGAVTGIASGNALPALSNLASVACNLSLVSDTANTDDLGTEALYWKKLYLASDISFEGATDNDYQTTLTAVDTTVGDKTINIPNADGTMAVSATAPATLSALGDIGVTVLKDIVTTAPLAGAADNVLPGADSDLTLSIDNISYTLLADGTAGNLITWDANGAPALVATGTDGQVLTSAGAGAAPTFEDASGGVAGDASVNPTNLLSNGDFENHSAGTTAVPDGFALESTPTLATDTGDIGYGSISQKITAAGAGLEGIKYTLSGLRASTIYSVSWRTKVTAGDTSQVLTTGAGTDLAATESTSTTFETKKGTFTTDASGTAVVLKFMAKADGDIVWFDGVQVNQGESAFAFADKPMTLGIMDWSWWGIKTNRLITAHAGDNTRVVINADAYSIPIVIGTHCHILNTVVDVDATDDLDTGTLAAGTDYVIYACTDGSQLSFKTSINQTNPSGFDAAHSRKIGGFHTLCVAVGTISGHSLTDFAVKDILPASIWDLHHRPVCSPNGMVYSTGINKWVDIYLASGTGASTASVYGATITDTRTWNDFVDDGGAVKKCMLGDGEFQVIATGSNEETNITGSGDPETTGGHVDTAARRMISNIGVEDACGALYQWLKDQSSMNVTQAAGYYDLPNGKGSIYRPANIEDVKLIAGGAWVHGAYAGSSFRAAHISRWVAASVLGCRFCAEPV